MTYQGFKEAVAKTAAKLQVTDYELYYMEMESASVEIYKEEVSKYKTEGSMGICFRCIVDGKAGYASTENLEEGEVESLVLRAVENAKSIESEETSFLYKKGDTYAEGEEVQEDMPTGAELTAAAMQIQKEMYQADSRIVDGTQAFSGYVKLRYALYNSNGLDLEDKAAYASCVGMALASDGREMYNGSKLKHGRLEEIDLKEVAGKAVEKAVSTIGADSVASGKYTVVFSNEVMATLLSTYSSVFSAEQAQKGLSLLQGKEGEMIAADNITIVDDPRYKDSLIKRTFDGEGVAAYAKNVVENGKLITLLHNLQTAAKAGVKTTGNASKASYSSVVGVSPFAFYLCPVEGTKEDLFREAGEGIYVTDVTGLHAGANPITGDFSLSSKGFLITDGRKGAPIREFTVSGNFFSLLKEIERVGEDIVFPQGKYGAPSVLVRNLAVAGK